MNRVDRIVKNKKKYYKRYKIKKSNGDYRIIIAPDPELKLIQKAFLQCIYSYIDVRLPDYIKGFRKGTSIVDNAKIHLNPLVVINVDIKDYFPSIPSSWIKEFLNTIFKLPRIKTFKRLNDLSGLTKDKMFELLTVNNKLPQGSPCSPILANYYLTSIGFDSSMNSFGGWRYSRYADDLTFSTQSTLLADREYIKNYMIPSIFNYLKRAELKPSKHKTTIKFKDQKQLVNGVLVNGNEPKIPTDKFQRIKTAIYQNGLNKQNKGYLSYINSVNKTQLKKLQEEKCK